MIGNRKIQLTKQIKFIGPLNNSQTVHLAASLAAPEQKFIAKSIYLGTEYAQNKAKFENSLKKLYGSSYPNIVKPQVYGFDDQKMYVYLFSPIMGVSLEQIIMHHKKIFKPIEPSIIYNFACKLYDLLIKMKKSGTDFYHRNLKPSNIFFQSIPGQEKQIVWKVTECGLFTKYPNQFYRKPVEMDMMQNKSNLSFSVDSSDYDLYSLGIILLQMMTLAPIEKITKNIKTERTIQSLEELRNNRNLYGQQLISFINLLINPRQNLKEIFQIYKKTSPELIIPEDYTQIGMTIQKFENLLKEEIYNVTIERMARQVAEKSITGQDIINYAQKFDPELNFYFTQYEQLERFLINYGVELRLTQEEEQKEGKQCNPWRKLYDLSFFLLVSSTINYMEIVKYTLSAKEIIETVIKKAIENYRNRRQFFQAETNGRSFWKIDEVHSFMARLNIFLNEKDVAEVVRQWAGLGNSGTGGVKPNSVKYEQFSKVFKDSGKEGLGSSRSRTNKTIKQEKSLREVLQQIKQKIPENNLFTFFRKFDVKNRWIVWQSINDQLKKFTTLADKSFKNIMGEMWQKYGEGPPKGRVLPYLQILRKQKVYEAPEIFRMILAEKIDELGKEEFYKKYAKDQRGWNFTSLLDFNHDERLEFDERQLKMLFNEMDKDNSEYLNEKQLIYQLTGLKQFDLEFIVEKIKMQVQQKRIDLFNEFVDKDRHQSMCLQTPGDLASVLIDIKIELPSNHYVQIYEKHMTGDRFNYLLFLRYFYPLPELFVKACIFVIQNLYNGNFEKFYNVGLTHGRKKWNRNSLVKINSDLVLYFSENQIGEIWKTFDPNNDGSLTKTEVAEIFKCNYDGKDYDEDLLPINSTDNFIPQSHQSISKHSDRVIESEKGFIKTEQPQKGDIIHGIKKRDMVGVAECFVKKSRSTGSLSIDEFCQCLTDLSIPHMRNMVIKQTSKFQFSDETKSMKINFINFLMYVCQQSENSLQKTPEECEIKGKVLMAVLREIVNYDELSIEDIFKKCRKQNKMKLTDYENFVKQTLKVDIYFDDIEDTWKSFGDVDYLQQKDLEQVLMTKKPSLTRKISFEPIKSVKEASDNPRHSFGKADDGIQSPHFPNHMKSRRSSRDSKELEEKIMQVREPEASKFNRRQSNREQIKYPPKSNHGPTIGQKRKGEDSKNNLQKQESQTPRLDTKIQQRVSKEEALEKLSQGLSEKGLDPMNELFTRANTVGVQRFSNILIDKYEIPQEYAIKIGECLSSFGKIKIETIRKYLPKSSHTLNKPQHSSVKANSGVNDDINKKIDKGRKAEPEKGKKEKIIDPSMKLIDKRKTKISVPVIKQQIRILINSFCKKYEINKMQSFFFEGSTTIDEERFIEKCRQINDSLSVSIYKKIFIYLEPSNNMITSLSFKLKFSFDEEIEIDETYLPEELESELKNVFDQADADKSGYIEIKEMEKLLTSLGMNETQKQIEIQFQKMDHNFDKKISYLEFRKFLEQNIIPYLSDFDEECDKLLELFKMNDIFRTGTLSVPVVGAIIHKYGIKLDQSELMILSRFLANQNGEIRINDLISALYFPSQPRFSPGLKSILYKIRWKRKITFKDVQKVFKSISSCFVISYTQDVMKKRILAPSTFVTPHLDQSQYFYQDIPYKNSLMQVSTKQNNLKSTINPNDIVVQLRLLEASGLPIPQHNGVKSSILSRSANLTFYDISGEEVKWCITTLHQIEFDADIQDLWTFSKNFKNVFIKVNKQDSRQLDHILLLIQFIITISNTDKETKSLAISCGSCSIPLKELINIEGKISRKYKIVGGIPNKSKDIDRMSVSKRKGWRGIIKNEAESQLSLQIIPPNKFEEKLPLIASMPLKTIINRKSLDFIWTFREYFALKSIDVRRINPDYCHHFLVKTFLLCLDIPDVAQLAPILWKEKIEQKVPNFESRMVIINRLLSEMFLIIHSKQFELLPSFPNKSSLINKSLRSLRQKLIVEVFNNIENWIGSGISKEYKRKKAYNCDYQPFKIEEKQVDIKVRAMAQKLLDEIIVIIRKLNNLDKIISQCYHNKNSHVFGFPVRDDGSDAPQYTSINFIIAIIQQINHRPKLVINSFDFVTYKNNSNIKKKFDNQLVMQAFKRMHAQNERTQEFQQIEWYQNIVVHPLIPKNFDLKSEAINTNIASYYCQYQLIHFDELRFVNEVRPFTDSRKVYEMVVKDMIKDKKSQRK